MPIPKSSSGATKQGKARKNRSAARSDYSTGELTAACGNQRHEQHFGGRKQRRKSQRFAARPASTRRQFDIGNVDELNERRRPARALQRAPISIVAQITSGIAGQSRGKAARSHRAQQLCERRCTAQRAGLAALDRPARRAMAADIRVQHRQRIAGPRFDTEVSAPPSNAEDQNEIGFFSKELRQVAIDGRIAGGKNVGRANDISKCWAGAGARVRRPKRRWD